MQLTDILVASSVINIGVKVRAQSHSWKKNHTVQVLHSLSVTHLKWE